MPKSAHKRFKLNRATKEFFIYIALLFVLLLTSINISIFVSPKEVKVLGVETQNKEEIFWQDFLSKNPDYVPGWIETGNVDKAKSINPNYIKP
jgi:hypothetical protein